MKYDEHDIHVEVRANGWKGFFTQPYGDIKRAEERARKMAQDDGRAVTHGRFIISLKRNGIQVQAWSLHDNEPYQDVLNRADRILVATEAIHTREHEEEGSSHPTLRWQPARQWRK